MAEQLAVEVNVKNITEVHTAAAGQALIFVFDCPLLSSIVRADIKFSIVVMGLYQLYLDC